MISISDRLPQPKYIKTPQGVDIYPTGVNVPKSQYVGPGFAPANAYGTFPNPAVNIVNLSGLLPNSIEKTRLNPLDSAPLLFRSQISNENVLKKLQEYKGVDPNIPYLGYVSKQLGVNIPLSLVEGPGVRPANPETPAVVQNPTNLAPTPQAAN